MSEQRYVQVGETCFRNPVTKEYLYSVPLYVKEEDTSPEVIQKCAQTFAQMVAVKMRQYEEAAKKAKEKAEAKAARARAKA